jgi:hypothetical protein
MIAVMIAAAMCVVPLFVIEDSEAVTVTTGEKAISFKGESIKVEDWEATMDSDSMYAPMMMVALQLFGTMDITPSDEKITELNIFSRAIAEKVTDSQIIEMTSQKMKYKADMTVTLNSAAPGIQIDNDGAQDVFREFNNLPAGAKVVIKGLEVMTETSMKETNDYVVNEDKNLVITKKVTETSTKYEISFNDAEYKAAEITKKVSFNMTTVMSVKETDTYTYYTADFKDQVDATKAVVTTKLIELCDKRGSGMEGSIDVNINGKSYSDSQKRTDYESGDDVSTPTFSNSTAGAKGTFINVDVAPDTLYVYGNGGNCLFHASDVKEPLTMDNAKLTKALEGMGTVSTDYGDAESIVNDSSSSVGGSGGNNNIVFYVIIGVLAVAVVALAVLMIKKK